MISHLSKLWKARFLILGDVIFLVRLQEKFEIDHKGSTSQRACNSRTFEINLLRKVTLTSYQ